MLQVFDVKLTARLRATLSGRKQTGMVLSVSALNRIRQDNQRCVPCIRRVRGVGSKEGLLLIFIVIAACLILIPVAVRQRKEKMLLSEAGLMRRVYVALAFYEEQYDNAPAPTLVAASAYDPHQGDYQSPTDPFVDIKASGKGFPNDPGLDNGETAPFRISFSYLLNFTRAKKLKVKSWEETRRNPLIGEIADEWTGSVTPGTPFQAQVSGPVLRIGTDGAVFQLKDRGGPKPLGDAEDLFIKR